MLGEQKSSAPVFNTRFRHRSGFAHVPNRIYVSGVGLTTTEAALKSGFQAHGNVTSVNLILDSNGANKGYGFVTFESSEEAHRLCMHNNSITLSGRRLYIAPAYRKLSRSPPPPISPADAVDVDGNFDLGKAQIICQLCPPPGAILLPLMPHLYGHPSPPRPVVPVLPRFGNRYAVCPTTAVYAGVSVDGGGGHFFGSCYPHLHCQGVMGNPEHLYREPRFLRDRGDSMDSSSSTSGSGSGLGSGSGFSSGSGSGLP